MNTHSIELILRGAGLILTGLVVANFVAARRFGYARNLAGADVMVRQIFHVHCAYIVGIIAVLALLCLGWPELLLEGRMSNVVSGFFAIFWGSRVIVQLTYYDPDLRRAERGWDVFFLGVFAALTAAFAIAAFHR